MFESVLWCVPVAIFWSWKWLPAPLLLGLLLGVLVLRSGVGYIYGRGKDFGLQRRLLISSGLILVGMIGMRWVNKEWAFVFYPPMVSGVMGCMFLYSFFVPPCLIDQFALVKGLTVNKKEQKYTKKLTLAWGFFCWTNMVISLGVTLMGSQSWWIWYNGFFSYMLMGLFFMGEYGVRSFYKARFSDEIK